MGRNWRLVMLCTVLWTTAIALMVCGSFRPHPLVMMAWGGFVALVACILSGWLVAICAATLAVQRERLDLEHLAEIMAQCAANEAATTRIK